VKDIILIVETKPGLVILLKRSLPVHSSAFSFFQNYITLYWMHEFLLIILIVNPYLILVLNLSFELWGAQLVTAARLKTQQKHSNHH
jgi:hypothetical protein